MRPNPQETANLVTFTEESLMENFIFCAVDVEQSVESVKRQSIKKQYFSHIKTINLPCVSNSLAGFYMWRALVA